MQAKLAYKKPQQFRLVGEVLGNQEMDIGSNEKEFWCWIKWCDPPLSYHGKYQTWAKSRTLPLAPDWLLDLLGLSEQKEPPIYELSVLPKTIELTQASSFFSRAKRKISVFNRSPHPIPIAGYRLEDAAGKELYSASITEMQRDRATGAVLPRRLELNWPEQRITIKATLADIAVNAPLDRERAARRHSRRRRPRRPERQRRSKHPSLHQ
ncbi:MAG TPA: hypothetical protein VGY66_31125 [Gemmataceae bacterium]|jgi:hypothetical protein|nr:hypothetical protein [Gemmataceae bacterium]